MSYQGDGEANAILRTAADVETLQIRTTSARLVASGSLTEGRYGLYRWDMAPTGGGATPHFHRTFSESFYVVAGQATLYDGRAWVAADEGAFLYVPEGGRHGFRNDSGAPVSLLILFAPAPPREQYFRELAEIFASGRTLNADEWVEFWARHDQFPVEE